jgi:hypothetical protein
VLPPVAEDHLTLPWPVKPAGAGFHEAVQVSGGVALETAADLGVGLLLGSAAGEVVLCRFVSVDHPPVHDGVEGSVEAAVAESVEAMASDAARGRR